MAGAGATSCQCCRRPKSAAQCDRHCGAGRCHRPACSSQSLIGVMPGAHNAIHGGAATSLELSGSLMRNARPIIVGQDSEVGGATHNRSPQGNGRSNGHSSGRASSCTSAHNLRGIGRCIGCTKRCCIGRRNWRDIGRDKRCRKGRASNTASMASALSHIRCGGRFSTRMTRDSGPALES